VLLPLRAGILDLRERHSGFDGLAGKMGGMGRQLTTGLAWTLAFLCACSSAIQNLPAPQRASAMVMIRPGSGHQAVSLTREEFKQGMSRLWSRGSLPGVSRSRSPRLILAGLHPVQSPRVAGYLQFCEQLTGERKDCWDALTPEGGLDVSGSLDLALRFAFGEALRDAATAVGSITPDQVRAILSMTFIGLIVELLSPDPVTKALFIITTANLIAFIGVDLFNNVVKGYLAMADELAVAQSFAQVRAAGERYGQRIGPTLGRIIVMVASYGVAKFAGMFSGNALSLPGGSPAAALADSQGLRIPAAESARSISLATDGTIAIDLGPGMAMAVGEKDVGGRARARQRRTRHEPFQGR